MSEKIGTEDVRVVRELVKLMSANNLVELEISNEGRNIHLRRPEPASRDCFASPMPQYNPMPVAPASAPAPEPVASSPTAPAAADNLSAITSPIVGTFYTAPSPDSEPFVKIGDRVSADTVVCIIEAMKVMNEIKAETSGIIEQMLVSNGEAVEFGQALFKVKAG
ncbi:MAG: acetyl-CoA carboxylase biotin carboxyl carrier protein [Phycisphaerae bacterium]